MKLPTILLVDDDPDFLNSMANGLRLTYDVSAFLDYESAFDQIIENPPDVAICDVFIGSDSCIPKIEAVRRLAKDSKILVLTGNPLIEHLISLINLNVDGFIEKPCTLTDIAKKINDLQNDSSLAATAIVPAPEPYFEVLHERRAVRAYGKLIELTRIEFMIVSHLSSANGRVCTREEISELLWPGTAVSKHALDTHLYNLKKKSKVFEDVIVSVHGQGFLLET